MAFVPSKGKSLFKNASLHFSTWGGTKLEYKYTDVMTINIIICTNVDSVQCYKYNVIRKREQKQDEKKC